MFVLFHLKGKNVSWIRVSSLKLDEWGLLVFIHYNTYCVRDNDAGAHKDNK